MRALTALPPALAAAIAFSCGHDARVASPATSEVPPSAANSNGVAPPAASAAGSAAVAGASSASPVAPPPIDGALPSPEALTLSTKASCPAKTCRLEGSLLEALLGAPDNRSPAGIWEEDLGAGAAVSFARRTDVDVLGITLAGSVTLASDEAKGGDAELAPWHAFVAPGGGITLRAKGGPARFVLIVVTAGEAPTAKVAATKASAWTSRPSRIASVDLTMLPDLAWGKGAYHARIGFGGDVSAHASLGILKMSAEGVVPPHVHEKEWEHMAILQGEGDFIQGNGDEEHTLHGSDGVIFSVAPGTRHQWKPAGSRSFLGIQVYTPPGPEQRFKKLAAAP